MRGIFYLTRIFTIPPLLFAVIPFCLAAEGPTALVKTVPIQKRVISEKLKVYGILEADPDHTLSLSLPYAGLINRVWVRPGQRVKSGQKLLEVITAPDDRMKYLQAKSAMDFAQRNLARVTRLFKEHLATKGGLDASRSRLIDAKTSLNALKIRRLDRPSEIMRSPMNGIVSKLDVAQGQRVQADITAILIASEKKLMARLGVEPEDTFRIKKGTPVLMTSVFIPGISVRTSVREIHAMVDQNTHLVDVIVPIPENFVDQMILGSRVVAIIMLKSMSSLVVPRSAVLRLGDKSYVYTLSDGKAKRIFVKTGLEQGNEVTILGGGLKTSDRVVSLGNYELQPGMSAKEMK